MTQEVNKTILSLIKPEYLDRLPESAKEHATNAGVAYIAKTYPELYEKAQTLDPLPDDVKDQLSQAINKLFEERLAKHHL